MEWFIAMSGLSAFPVGQWHSGAFSVWYKILVVSSASCGSVTFYAKHLLWESLEEPSVWGTSKMCFALHSVTMKSMQIVLCV